jgi:hypothetical protein
VNGHCFSAALVLKTGRRLARQMPGLPAPPGAQPTVFRPSVVAAAQLDHECTGGFMRLRMLAVYFPAVLLRLCCSVVCSGIAATIL